MINLLNQPEKKSFDPEFPVSPPHALLLVAFSVIMIGFFGVLVRAILESVFGQISWSSPFLILELLIIAPSIYVVNRYKMSIKKAFRFNSVSIFIVLLSVVLGFSIAVIGDQLDRIMQKWFPMPSVFVEAIENIFLTSNIVDYWFILLIATVGAGICEEMLFRGFLQRIFEKKFQIAPALLIPAVLFGLIHILPWLFFQIILIGLVLGLLAWRTNSIYPPIIVHALNNLIGSLYIRFHTPEIDAYYVSNGLVNPTIVLIAIAIFIIVGKLLWTITEKNQTFTRYVPPDQKQIH